MALDVCTGFIAMAIRDHLRLWPDQNSGLDTDQKRLVDMWEKILKWDNNPEFVGAVQKSAGSGKTG